MFLKSILDNNKRNITKCNYVLVNQYKDYIKAFKKAYPNVKEVSCIPPNKFITSVDLVVSRCKLNGITLTPDAVLVTCLSMLSNCRFRTKQLEQQVTNCLSEMMSTTICNGEVLLNSTYCKKYTEYIFLTIIEYLSSNSNPKIKINIDTESIIYTYDDKYIAGIQCSKVNDLFYYLKEYNAIHNNELPVFICLEKVLNKIKKHEEVKQRISENPYEGFKEYLHEKADYKVKHF